jgi:hypothetical protein
MCIHGPRPPSRRRFLTLALIGAGVAAGLPAGALCAIDLLVPNITGLYSVRVARVETPLSTADVVRAVRAWPGPIAVGGARYSMGGQVAVAGGAAPGPAPHGAGRLVPAFGTTRAGTGRHALARPPGPDRSARTGRAHDAKLRQLHGRRLGVGQRPRPLRRQRPGRALGPGPATGAGRRIGDRSPSRSARRAVWCGDRRLRCGGRDHRGRARADGQQSARARGGGSETHRLSRLLCALDPGRREGSPAQRRPVAARLRCAGGGDVAPDGQPSRPGWCSAASLTPPNRT